MDKDNNTLSGYTQSFQWGTSVSPVRFTRYLLRLKREHTPEQHEVVMK